MLLALGRLRHRPADPGLPLPGDAGAAGPELRHPGRQGRQSRRPRIRPICRSRPPQPDRARLYRGELGARRELRRHPRLRRRPGPRAGRRHARSVRRPLGLSRLRLPALFRAAGAMAASAATAARSSGAGTIPSGAAATTSRATRSIRASSTWTSSAPATASRCSRAMPRRARRPTSCRGWCRT